MHDESAMCLFLHLKLSSPFCFFFKATAPTEIYTLSLHDALPISTGSSAALGILPATLQKSAAIGPAARDRKSTRLNSSHLVRAYAVFCLKKKNKNGIRVKRIENKNSARDGNVKGKRK